MEEKEIQTNWEMLCYDVLTIKQIELLKQKFQLIKEEAQKELLDEKVIDILRDLIYWDTCPEEYKKEIKKFMSKYKISIN